MKTKNFKQKHNFNVNDNPFISIEDEDDILMKDPKQIPDPVKYPD